MSYLDDFDPNAMPEPYATYTRGRTPHFKLHSALAHATAAMTAQKRSGIILYERQGDRWVQIARFEQNYWGDLNTSLPHTCEQCGANLIGQDAISQKPFNTGAQFLRRHNRKLVKPLAVVTLCGSCARLMGY